WRGKGTAEANQYNPKVFYLPAGAHRLIVRGREPNCQLGQITLVPQATKSAAAARPAPILRIVRSNGGIRLSWSSDAGDYVLQTKPAGSSAENWEDVEATPVLVNGRFVIEYPVAGTGLVYQLRAR